MQDETAHDDLKLLYECIWMELHSDWVASGPPRSVACMVDSVTGCQSAWKHGQVAPGASSPGIASQNPAEWCDS